MHPCGTGRDSLICHWLLSTANGEATNAENLTAHFAALEAIVEEHNIDPSRIAKLDETGVSLSRD